MTPWGLKYAHWLGHNGPGKIMAPCGQRQKVSDTSISSSLSLPKVMKMMRSRVGRNSKFGRKTQLLLPKSFRYKTSRNGGFWENYGTSCHIALSTFLLFEVPLTSSIASCMKVGSFSSSSVQMLPALLYDPDLTRSEGERHFPHFNPSTWVPHTLLTLLSLKSRPPSLALISCQDSCRQAETRRPRKLDFHLASKID